MVHLALTEKTGQPKRLGAVVHLAMVLAAFAFICVVLEFVLTALLPPPINWKHPQESYIVDPILGHSLTPRQHSFTHSYPVVTNSHGFRDREVSMVAYPGVRRILCLGDSLTFGDGVASEDTYPKQLEAMLNAAEPERYEVINAGVPSYDTWQEVAFFKTRGALFKPDMVIVGFYSNDIVPKPAKVDVSLAEGGALRRQGFSGLVPDKIAHLFKRSLLLLFLRDRIGKLANQFYPSFAYLHQHSLLLGEHNDFVERGWKEVEESLREMANLQEIYKFTLLVVAFPMAEQLMHDYPNADYPMRLKSIADKYQIAYIDLKPSFGRNFRGFGSLFIEWDGHPNVEAFNISATEIKNYVHKFYGKL